MKLNDWLQHPTGAQALVGISICLVSATFLIKAVGGLTPIIGHGLGVAVMALIFITSILINYFKAKKKI